MSTLLLAVAFAVSLLLTRLYYLMYPDDFAKTDGTVKCVEVIFLWLNVSLCGLLLWSFV